MRRITCPALAILSAATLGCSMSRLHPVSSCDASAPLELSPARRDSLTPPDDGNQPDAMWARLARRVPGGFAGVYLEAVPWNGNGEPVRPQRIVMRLVRPAEGRQAFGRILPLLGPSIGGVRLDSASVRVEPARWDFAQLDEWRRYLDPRVMVPGRTSADTDEGKNRIFYGVPTAGERDTLLARLRALRVPCGLVAVEIMGIPRPL